MILWVYTMHGESDFLGVSYTWGVWGVNLDSLNGHNFSERDNQVKCQKQFK